MTNVAKFYDDVIEDVINGMKEEFADEGLDTQILVQLQKIRSFVPTSSGVRQLPTSTGPLLSGQIATAKPILTVAPLVQPCIGSGINVSQAQFSSLMQQRRVNNGTASHLPLATGVGLNQGVVAPLGGAMGLSASAPTGPANTANIVQHQGHLSSGAGLRLPLNTVLRPGAVGLGMNASGNLTLPLQNPSVTTSTTTATGLGHLQPHFIQTGPMATAHPAPQFATLPSGITGMT
ncbi:unnamed protein product [Protopolystoma xenopodis]|uniref:Uncharacterized protein n=1 Tax=Protopolystoma xenopodis TaxID=117903 RepID=A0A3S5B4B2_9PLAT|nr:unnamed protein product [Protopolystoma xenopodis]